MAPAADLISNLPDDILSTIISRLSARDLLRTSVLSHRFRRLKIFTPSLDLSFTGSADAALCLLLPRNHSPHIDISLLPTPNDPLPLFMRSTPAVWIPHLAATLETLTLSIAPNGNINDILAIPSLRDLTLFAYIFPDTWQPPDDPVLGLRSLQVKNCLACDYQIEALSSAAPFVERLVLSQITLQKHGRKRMQIRSDVLKLLQIEMMALQTLEIDTPALTTLMLNNSVRIETDIVIINAPSLLIFDTTTTGCDERRGGSMYGLIEKLCGNSLSRALQIPGIPKRADLFVGIRKLVLEMDLRNYVDIRALRTLLGRCSNIQELGIDMSHLKLLVLSGRTHEQFYSNGMSWKRDDNFTCLENHLEHIWIKGFTGRKLEMDFMKYILEKAAMLQSVVILYDSYCRVAKLKELELIKTRTSSDWSITMKQGTARTRSYSRRMI